MGLAKTKMVTDRQNKIALFVKVFKHPAKVAVLQYAFKVAGTSICYCINTENLMAMKDVIYQFFNQDISKKEYCC